MLNAARAEGKENLQAANGAPMLHWQYLRVNKSADCDVIAGGAHRHQLPEPRPDVKTA